MRIGSLVASLFVLAGAFASRASAHVSLAGPGFAGTSQVLTFSIGHGCEGADTVALEIAIPKEITTVRAMPNVFGDATVTSDDKGAVTAVSWTKQNARPADDQFYQMQIRVALPKTPFVTLLFPATQTCKDRDGNETVVEWKATPEEVAAAKMGEEPEPAPALALVPARKPGWNKFSVSDKLTTLAVFDDAQIVWSGDAAYSSNPATMDQIMNEKGVTVLTEIAAGAEIWVKY